MPSWGSKSKKPSTGTASAGDQPNVPWLEYRVVSADSGQPGVNRRWDKNNSEEDMATIDGFDTVVAKAALNKWLGESKGNATNPLSDGKREVTTDLKSFARAESKSRRENNGKGVNWSIHDDGSTGVGSTSSNPGVQFQVTVKDNVLSIVTQLEKFNTAAGAEALDYYEDVLCPAAIAKWKSTYKGKFISRDDAEKVADNLRDFASLDSTRRIKNNELLVDCGVADSVRWQE